MSLSHNEKSNISKKILYNLPNKNEDLELFIANHLENLTWAIEYLFGSSDFDEVNAISSIITRIEGGYVRAGLLFESKKMLDVILNIYRKNNIDPPSKIASFKGNVERLLDNYSNSESDYKEALNEKSLIGVERAKILLGQGDNQKQMQNYEAAELSYKEAISISDMLENSSEIKGVALWGLANIEFATSRWNV